MKRQAWLGHVDRRAWLLPSATVAAMVGVASYRRPLLPIARGFRDLCARYPVLALVTRHLPPLPIAFLLAIGGVMTASAAAAGCMRLARTQRFIWALDRRRSVTPMLARLARLSERLDLGGRVLVLDQVPIAAFCFGFLHPRIAVSSSLVATLDDEELLAVLAHERHHLRRRDPLRYLFLHAAGAAACMFPLSGFVRRRLETRIELAADKAAMAVTSRGALAGALLAVLTTGDTAVIGAAGLTATEARIAHLIGSPTTPAVPMRAIMASLVPVGVMVVASVDLSASANLVTMACALCARAA